MPVATTTRPAATRPALVVTPADLAGGSLDRQRALAEAQGGTGARCGRPA